MGTKVLEEVSGILRLQIHKHAVLRRQEHLLTVGGHLRVSHIFSLCLVTRPLLEHGALRSPDREGCHGSTPDSTHAVADVLALSERSVTLHVHLSLAVRREPSSHDEVVLVASTTQLLVTSLLFVVDVELRFDEISAWSCS